MNILITGSRDWNNFQLIYNELKKVPKYFKIIQGCCRGADLMAWEAATLLKLETIDCPADWAKYGKYAGLVRNSEMLKHNPVWCLGFHPDLHKSRGTMDMLKKTRKAGIPIKLVKDEESFRIITHTTDEEYLFSQQEECGFTQFCRLHGS